MKKAISVILDIILTLAAVFVLTGPSVRHICAQAATEAVVEQTAASIGTDEIRLIFPEVTEGQIESVKKRISQDKHLRKLTGEYIDALALAAASGEPFESPDVSSVMDQVADDNMDTIEALFDTELTGLHKMALRGALASVGEQIESELEKASQEALAGMTGEQKTVLELYNFLTSDTVRTTVSVIAAAAVFGIVMLRLKKGRFLFHLGVSGILSGLTVGFVIPAALQAAAGEAGRQLSGSGLEISTESLSVNGIWLLAAGAALTAVYLLVKLFYMRKKKKRYRRC